MIDQPEEVYAVLLESLRDVDPLLADQVSESIAEGRRVDSRELQARRSTQSSSDSGGPLKRILLLDDEDTGDGGETDGRKVKISREDLATERFSGDERLSLLLEAIETTIGTVLSSRDALRLLVKQLGVPAEIVFSPGDDEGASGPAGEVRTDLNSFESEGELRESVLAVQDVRVATL